MLSSIEVHAAQSTVAVLTLPVGDVPTAPLHIRKAEGLEPVKADVNTLGYSSLDGETYTGSHAGKRNIVLTVGLNTRYGYASVEQARRQVYAYFMPKTMLELWFVTSGRPKTKILCYVESCENDRWSQDPTMTISLICPKPYFQSTQLGLVTGMSNLSPVPQEFIYNGDVIAPVVFDFHLGGIAYSGPVTLETRGVETTWRKLGLASIDIPSNKYLYINTTPGAKELTLKGESATLPTTNLLGKKTDESVWTYLVPGVNRVQVRTTETRSRPWALRYYEQYGGL